MIIGFSSRAWEDYLYWQKEDKKVRKRINLLIADAGKNPTGGIGNTEALKHNLSGWYSKRITQEHRMIYRFSSDMLEIISLKTHYGI